MSKKQNKYQKNYQYKNHLTKCPNCNAPLNESDHDCPYCHINLVGYNEKHNMADNLSDYANQMDEIVDKHNELNDRIRKDNEKIQERKQLKKNAKKFLVALIIVGIVTSLAFGLVVSLIENTKSQTCDEVRKYFNSYAPENIKVDELDYNFEVAKELTDERYDALYGLQVGYDKATDITILRETYQHHESDNQYSVLRILTGDVASMPKADLSYGEVSYGGRYSFVNMSDEFVKLESSMTPDKYILVNYTNDDGNFIEKLPTLTVEGTTVFLYSIGTSRNSDRSDRVIGLVQLESNLFYVADISVAKTEIGNNPVVENLEKYFYIVEE